MYSLLKWCITQGATGRAESRCSRKTRQRKASAWPWNECSQRKPTRKNTMKSFRLFIKCCLFLMLPLRRSKLPEIIALHCGPLWNWWDDYSNKYKILYDWWFDCCLGSIRVHDVNSLGNSSIEPRRETTRKPLGLLYSNSIMTGAREGASRNLFLLRRYCHRPSQRVSPLQRD